MSPPSRRDLRIADETPPERSLMCAATGCPNRWSIDRGNGKLCRWHDASPSHRWPAITQEQVDADADRIRAAGMDRPAPVPVDRAAAVQALRDFRLGPNGDPRAWARALQRREEAGEKLSVAQLQMWRDALKHQPALAEEEEDDRWTA